VKSGVVAWDGALAFWVAGLGAGGQIIIISIWVYLAACRTDLPSEVEIREGALLSEEAFGGRFVSREEVERLVERLVGQSRTEKE
jgi:hypothetical protein